MTDLERRLHARAGEAFPPVPDVAAAVATRIAADANARDPGVATRLRGWLATPRRRLVALTLALVLLPTAAVAAVPDARHAVLEWLGLEHVRVQRVPQLPPLPSLDRADLGTRVATVAEAQRRAGFAIVVPDGLGAPDGVYVGADGLVSLAYEPRQGLPRDEQTGVGLLVTELRAGGLPDYFAKTAGPRTLVEPVRVNGGFGAFLSGDAHGVLLERPDGEIRELPARLAGNTLVYERGDLVIRLEGRFDRRAALALARTLR